MPSLVTGASGHIGSNLVRILLNSGEKVRAMVRKESNISNLPKHGNLELVHGDVYDPPSLVRALDGCQLVYHTAAVYSLSKKNPGSILQTAMQGTRNILESVKVAGGVKRVVYTSSQAAVGMTSDPAAPLNESNWTEDADLEEYTKAKLDSEKLAHSLASEYAIDLVAVNPSLVLGPLDSKPTPSNKIVVDFLQGKVPAYIETGFSAVHVEDVAMGHFLAMSKGRKGERYILSGDNITLGDFFKELEKVSGKKAPGLRLPKFLAVGAAHVFEIMSNITKSDPVATVQSMKYLYGRYGFVSCEKAKTELGYKPRGLKETLVDTVKWFTENKV